MSRSQTRVKKQRCTPTEIAMDKAFEDYSNNDKLPEEVLGIIFQKIGHRKSLLNFRLVCKYWKNTFDNSRIMKELTFKVEDWRLFNESTIVDKVKSIYFNDMFLVTEEEMKNEWLQFCNRIGSTVEKIKLFCYCDNVGDIPPQAQLINSLVSSSINLKELHLDVDQFIFACLPEVKYEKIQNLFIDMFGTKGVLDKALPYFPNLVKLEIRGAWIPDLSTVLVEYAKARNGLLKEVVLNYPTAQNKEDKQEQLKFVFTCANFGFKIPDYNMPFRIDAEDLLTYEETEDAPVNEITCKIFQSTVIIFDNGINPLVTTRIGFCKNINGLILVFSRPVAFSELLFLPKLQKLQKLYLQIDESFSIDNDVNQVNLAGQIFQFEFPHLTCVQIKGDVFGQDINQLLPSFSIYFPNLKTLYLYCLRLVPNDIFEHLSKLELLKELEIQSIDELECHWTDDKFILPCESQHSVIPELVPAIAAFKNLTKLTIDGCHNLTDICVVHGIALSNTLKQVRILAYYSSQCQITEVSVNALQGSELEEGELTWINY